MKRELHSGIVLGLLVIGAFHVCFSHANAAPLAPREGDLVAPPLSLARLRVLLEECVSPPPTAEELSIVIELHRSMVASYGASSVGVAGDAWRAGNMLYDELRDMDKNPTRARLKEIFRLQTRMLADADAAERVLFAETATVLCADETLEAQKIEVRSAVARASCAREADRLFASLPMEEPSGVRNGMRDSIGRLRVSPEVFAQLRASLAQRDAALVTLLRKEMRDYESFALAAAGAFDEVFGGILPPLGAIFSDDEEARVRARMREKCNEEGEKFLATRRAVRALEDSTIDRLCAVLTADEAIELRLRLCPSIDGHGQFLVSTEGHVRDALRELPTDDPTRAAVAAFAPRWRAGLIENLQQEIMESRAYEDESFWEQSAWRGSSLAMRAQIGRANERPFQVELDSILAPRVVDAGGTLGNLVASKFESEGARLMQRATLGAWEKEALPSPDSLQNLGDKLSFYNLISVDESNLSAEYIASRGVVRRGIAPRMERADILTRMERDFTSLDASALNSCFDEAWTAHETRWNDEVESAIAPMTQARKDLSRFAIDFGVKRGGASDDAHEKLQALDRTLRLRDSAWRASEATDEAFFEALLHCTRANSAALRQAIMLERLRRFIERERRTCEGTGFVGAKVEPYPQWDALALRAGLSEAALARVRGAICEHAQHFASALIGVRQMAFDRAALTDATMLGLRNSVRFGSKTSDSAVHNAAKLRAGRAGADMLGAMLDAAAAATTDGDSQRALLASAALHTLFRGWDVDHSSQRTSRRALLAATSDEERIAIEQAVDNYLHACRTCNEHAAKLALANSSFAKTSDGQVLFAMPTDAATAGSVDRLKERLARDLRDLRASLDIDLLSILGRERWDSVAPPDMFELRGVGGRGE
jgi:hypothetical protein